MNSNLSLIVVTGRNYVTSGALERFHPLKLSNFHTKHPLSVIQKWHFWGVFFPSICICFALPFVHPWSIRCGCCLASWNLRPFTTLSLRCAVNWKPLFKRAAPGLASARLMQLPSCPHLCHKVGIYALKQPISFPAYGFSTSAHPCLPWSSS